MALILAVFAVACLSGCASAYRYDKDTIVVVSFGISATFFRRKDAEIETQPTESDETRSAE